MPDLSSVDPATFVAVAGALLGALVGGGLGLVGTGLNNRAARRQSRLDARRAVYVDYIDQVQRAERLEARLTASTVLLDVAKSKHATLRSAVILGSLSGDELAELAEIERAITTADQYGLSTAEMQASFDHLHTSYFALMLIPPKTIRRLATDLLTAVGSSGYSAALAEFMWAARLETKADKERWRHRTLRMTLWWNRRADRTREPVGE
jgi:hypothetical protein